MSKSPIDADTIKKDIFFGVGYAQPPEHSRFRKGTSGNPAGRPRSVTPSERTGSLSNSGANTEIFRRVLLEPVKVNKNGKPSLVHKAEAVQRTQQKLALNGQSVLALRDLKSDLRAEDARREVELENERHLWEKYIQCREDALSRSEKNGTSSQGFWIAPEDIVMIPGENVRIRGAAPENEVADFQFLQAVAQALLAKFFYDTIIFPKHHRARPEITACVIAIWVKANRMLSAQMERENHAYWQKLEAMVYRQPIVATATELKAKWGAINLPVPLKLPMFSPSPKILAKLRKSFPNNLAAAGLFRSPHGNAGSAYRKGRYRRTPTQ